MTTRVAPLRTLHRSLNLLRPPRGRALGARPCSLSRRRRDSRSQLVSARAPAPSPETAQAVLDGTGSELLPACLFVCLSDTGGRRERGQCARAGGKLTQLAAGPFSRCCVDDRQSGDRRSDLSLRHRPSFSCISLLRPLHSCLRFLSECARSTNWELPPTSSSAQAAQCRRQKATSEADAGGPVDRVCMRPACHQHAAGRVRPSTAFSRFCIWGGGGSEV